MNKIKSKKEQEIWKHGTDYSCQRKGARGEMVERRGRDQSKNMSE